MGMAEAPLRGFEAVILKNKLLNKPISSNIDVREQKCDVTTKLSKCNTTGLLLN